MEENRSSAEIEKDIKLAKELAVHLKEAEKRLAERLAVTRKEIDRLLGHSWGRDRGGEIRSLEKKLGDAKIREHRATCRKVVFEERGHWRPAASVVTRVTKKRIYYADAGTCNRESFVGLDGKPTGSYGHTIDIEKTFGPDWDQKTA